MRCLHTSTLKPGNRTRKVTETGGRTEEGVGTEHVRAKVKDHLVNLFAEQGDMRLVKYAEKVDWYTWKGERVVVRQVDMQFHWTLAGREALWEATFYLSPAVPLGCYDAALSRDGLKFRTLMVSYKWAGETPAAKDDDVLE